MKHSLVDNPASLSIRIHPGGFSLYVYGENDHLISQKTISTELFTAERAGILDRQAEINRPYKKTAIVCETNIYTILPEIFTETADYRSLLALQHPELDENWGIFYERMHNYIIVYALPRKFIQNLQSRLPDAGFFSHLMYPLKRGLELSGEHLTGYIRGKRVDFMWFVRKNLHYYNSFEYQTAEDITYHCLHLIDQLQLDTERAQLTFIGDEELVRPDILIGSYISQVRFIPQTLEYENYKW